MSLTDFLQTRTQSDNLCRDIWLTPRETGFSPAPGFYYGEGEVYIQAGGHRPDIAGRWYAYRVPMPWGHVYSDDLGELERILYESLHQ